MRGTRNIAKDRDIILELVRDPRQSNVSVAKKLGISEGAVRRRVERLVERGDLTFSAMPRPAYMGRPVHTLFRLQSAPGRNADLLAHITAMPEISYVYHVTGQFDLIAVGYFASNDAMRRFWTERLGSLDGVLESTSVMVLRVAKRMHEWARDIADDDPIPDLPEDARPRLRADA
jgi:Lrp/AsnC family transcriptional regulator, regulator for asnA, asnC and gidA